MPAQTKQTSNLRISKQNFTNYSPTEHPVYFQKISAAPFGNRSPKLRGALVCSWADLQNLQGGAAPPHQTETRWTEKESFLCLSALPVQAPNFGRLLCWLGVARYSWNYSGCELSIQWASPRYNRCQSLIAFAFAHVKGPQIPSSSRRGGGAQWIKRSKFM